MGLRPRLHAATAFAVEIRTESREAATWLQTNFRVTSLIREGEAPAEPQLQE
jgi:hypothetical protein